MNQPHNSELTRENTSEIYRILQNSISHLFLINNVVFLSLIFCTNIKNKKKKKDSNLPKKKSTANSSKPKLTTENDDKCKILIYRILVNSARILYNLAKSWIMLKQKGHIALYFSSQRVACSWRNNFRSYSRCWRDMAEIQEESG